jgi:D-alanyl-D-alanine carboxypeptidase
MVMNFYRFLLFFIVFGLSATNSRAQTVPPKLDAMLTRALDSVRKVLTVKSLSGSLQLPNNAVWTSASGISSNTPFEPATAAHAYCIGSVTKSITGACILQLVDEGKLKLDDKVQSWLGVIPFVDSSITIRQLLNHQSGLYDVITDKDYQKASQSKTDSTWSLSNLVRDYIKAPLFLPGTGWSYSNTNYAMLGMIIEKATGKTYYEEFRRRFFTPLNLKSLSLPPFDPKPSKIAHPWIDLNGDGFTDDFHNTFSKWRSFHTSAGPIGGYFANAADMSVWMKAFMSGKLHTPATMTEAKKTVNTTFGNGTRCGLGLNERKLQGLTAIGHGGDIIYSAGSYYFPAKDISITVLNNDALKNSWQLDGAILALLKAYMDYEKGVSSTNDLNGNILAATAFPNPFTDELNITITLPGNVGRAQVQLTNIMGQNCWNKTIERPMEGEQTIALSGLASQSSGTYLAHILLDGQRVWSGKVVK